MNQFHGEKWGPLGSIVAVACCLGGGPLVALLSAVGLSFLVTDFVFIPLVIFFLGVTLWSLWRGQARHAKSGPVGLAAVASIVTLAGFGVWWLVVVAGVLLVQAAAIWNLLALRRQTGLDGACQ